MKTVCGNTSRKNIDLYVKKVSNSIISQNGTNEQSSNESAYKNLCADAKATYPLKGNASDAELVWESACKSEINYMMICISLEIFSGDFLFEG